jgi:carboxypeptidase C (cathepsin A)
MLEAPAIAVNPNKYSTEWAISFRRRGRGGDEMRRAAIRVRMALAVGVSAFALAVAVGSAAAQPSIPVTPSEAVDAAPHDVPPSVEFVTRHVTKIRGAKVAFTARAGELYLYDDEGQPTASIFSFSYVRDNAGPNRPVVFIFGGGPGSASMMLHVGLLGPWRVPPERLAVDGPWRGSNLPPFDLVENSESILDVADLVFVDPVGTGFSRPVGKGRGEMFWGVDQDNEANAQFIAHWLSRNGRWNSPKFFLGESYGSVRGQIISNALMGSPLGNGMLRAVTLNGVILLATVTDMGRAAGATPDPARKAWSAAMSLPSEADTAWYHRKVDRAGRSIADFDAEVYRFAAGDYRQALEQEAAGALGADARKAIVDKLTGYTGLPASAFARSLAIPRPEFAKEILADRGLDVGTYDSRYALPARADAVDPVADDPALSRTFPIWTAAMEQLLHVELAVKVDRPYAEIHWRDLLAKWDFKQRVFPPAETYAIELARSMRRVEGMKVFVTAGYYDLVAPAAAARRDFEAAGAPPDRLTFKTYEGGHDLYNGGAADALADDIRAFIVSASISQPR